MSISLFAATNHNPIHQGQACRHPELRSTSTSYSPGHTSGPRSTRSSLSRFVRRDVEVFSRCSCYRERTSWLCLVLMLSMGALVFSLKQRIRVFRLVRASCPFECLNHNRFLSPLHVCSPFKSKRLIKSDNNPINPIPLRSTSYRER